MRHIALFSQTGSEIANLIDNGITPTSIISDQKNKSKIDKRIDVNKGVTFIQKKDVKNVQHLRDIFGDPLTCIITLHGWLNIIPKEICDEYQIYNGHPGLITKYPELKGKDPQVRAYEGDYLSIGSVIHRVTPGVDEGTVILSSRMYNDCKTLDDTFMKLKNISLKLWVKFFNTYL